MPNFIWYLALVLLSLGLFIYTFLKSKNKKIFALYFFTVGITYIFEFFILVLFNSYVYHPKVLKDPYFDNVLGSTVSNAFTVPITAVFIGSFQLGTQALVFFASLLVGIQAFFSYLGIYKDHWWGLPHTFIALLVAYTASKWWYRKLKIPITQGVRFINLGLIGISTAATTAFILAAITNSYFYTLDWFSDPTRSHVAFATIYIIIVSLVLTTMLTLNLKWPWLFAAVLVFYLLAFWLLQNNYLELNNWRLEYFLILRALYCFILLYFDRAVLIPKKV